MITIKDLSIASLKQDWKIRLCKNNPSLRIILKENILSIDDITSLKEQLNEFEQELLDKEIERIKKEFNTIQDLDEINIGHIRREERKSLEENMPSSILRVSLNKKDSIYSGWEYLPLPILDHTLTSYTLKGNRTYQEKPFSTNFRGVRSHEIKKIEGHLELFIDQMKRLQNEYQTEIPNKELFFYQQHEKKENIKKHWKDIQEYLKGKPNTIVGVLTKEELSNLKDDKNPLTSSMIELITNYVTPIESTKLSTKVLSRFVKK